MRRSKPDLIVPIRDRRQRRRVFTIRNTGFAMLAVIVAYLAISIRSEYRGGTPEGDYGRLYRRELPPPPAQQPPVEVVTEAKPVDDSVSADPMLMAPAARAQWLGADTGANTASMTAQAEPLTLQTARDRNARVAIVGGPEGVAAVDNAPTREGRKLRGGIFRAE